MKLNIFLTLFAAIFLSSWFPVLAGANSSVDNSILCENGNDLKKTVTDLQVPSCIATCQKLLKPDSDHPQKIDYKTNCENFYINAKKASEKTSTELVTEIAKRAGQCLGNAALSVAVDTVLLPYHAGKGLVQLIGYMLNNKTDPKNPIQSQTEFWKTCAKSLDCKRALARNTIQFQERNSDQSWKTSDSDVDKYIAETSFNELMQKAQHDQESSKRECERDLGEIRKQSFQKNPQPTFKDQQDIFKSLSSKRPHCPAALKMKPPTPPPEDFSEMKTEECVKKNPEPILCFSGLQKLAVAVACQGLDFDKEGDKFCQNVVEFFIPLPTAKATQTILKPLSNIAKTEGKAGLATEKEIVKVGVVSSAKSAEVTAFKNSYQEVAITTEAQNKAYISATQKASASSNSAKNSQVIVSENSVLKKCNDVLKDKNLCTSLTNYQNQNLHSNLQSLKDKYPDINFEFYSDFKSVQLSLQSSKEITPAMRKQILKDYEQIFQKSNGEFAAKAKELGIDTSDIGDAKNWFKAGSGSTLDEAALAARRARDEGVPSGKVMDYSSEEVQGEMSRRLSSVENTRQEVVGSSSMKGLTDRTADGTVLPKQEVFDLVRKSSSAEDLAQTMSNRYGREFSVADAQKLQSYSKQVDEFSPSILIAKRENVNLDNAMAGGASADFLGMGSANARATAAGLSGKTNLTEALGSVRKGEQEVTTTFKARMETFKKVVGGNVICSGDDCIRVASTALSESEKIRMLNDLARSPETRQVRMSFVGPGVAQEHRMQLATHGESIEKSFRKELEGHVDYSKLSKMTFGFDMKTTQLNQGRVDLIIGKNNSLNLTNKEKDEIQKAFSRALEKQNKTNYSQGTSTLSERKLIFVPGAGLITIDSSGEP